MRIVELQAQNVKRLKAVDITPKEHLQIIGGRNAQGKSSVLDAVALALTGKDAKKLNPRPLRDGEKSGKVTLNLGEYVVTRTFTPSGGGTLTVTAGDTRAKFPSPQRVLDELMGRLSFDPQEFIGLSAKDQAAALLDLVELPIDLDEVDREIAETSEKRLVDGRLLKALGAPSDIDTNAPEEEQSASTILNMIRSARDRNREISDARAESDSMSQKIVGLAHQIETLQSELHDARQARSKAMERVEFLGEMKDTSDMEAQLSSLEDMNALVRKNREAESHNRQIASARKAYDDDTAHIEALRDSKDKALAEAQFPIDGLGFDESGVTYRGVPLSQASSMEQLRVSMAIAMASNPKLRVIRIKDGSLLDDDSLDLVAHTAEENDYQVLMERVGTGDPGAIVIEDGQVMNTEKEM